MDGFSKHDFKGRSDYVNDISKKINTYMHSSCRKSKIHRDRNLLGKLFIILSLKLVLMPHSCSYQISCEIGKITIFNQPTFCYERRPAWFLDVVGAHVFVGVCCKFRTRSALCGVVLNILFFRTVSMRLLVACFRASSCSAMK
jgi:hypothetical protein